MTIPLEAGNRIQLPAAWLESLGIEGAVCLDKTDAGILVRPAPKLTWNEIFATKLPMGQLQGQANHVEVTRDDLVF